MFRLALLLLGVAICQVTAEPNPESEEPSTRLFGFPWINPTLILGSGGQATTVTTTVQVPLYVVRTTTVWQNGGVSTVYLPGTTQAPYTVYQPSYIYSTVTVWSGSGTSTSYITSYFPYTVTVNAAQQVVAVQTVTQFVAASEYGVTRTVIRDCDETFTRTRTRTRTEHNGNGYLTAGGGSTVSLTETQTIPPPYLKF